MSTVSGKSYRFTCRWRAAATNQPPSAASHSTVSNRATFEKHGPYLAANMHCMQPEILRAWWFERQGLNKPGKKSAAEILAQTGWARSVGGANPYMAFFSRARLPRTTVDKNLSEQLIHELPSARGCTYVVPKSHYALALKVGQPVSDPTDLVTAKKFLGVTEKEIEKLEDGIVSALKKSAKDPKELKETLGGAVRSLGEEGKKRGVTTTLPLALGRLQHFGRIRRISTDGRLDNQRYKYAAWDPSPLASYKLSREEALTELAKLYFSWIGPATLANFQWFSGLGVAASKNAVAGIGLVPIEEGSEFLILPQSFDAFHSFKVPKEEQIALVASIDNLIHLRRDLSFHLDDKDRTKKVMDDKALYEVGAVQDLTSHGIFDRGRLIGLWEYDCEANELVWKTFSPPTAGTKKVVKETEAYVRDELGDMRSFSLDSPASRKPKIEFLRK